MPYKNDMDRRRKLRERVKALVPPVAVTQPITNDLFESVRAVSSIGLFAGSAELILNWARKLPLPLQNELLLRGVAAAVTSSRVRLAAGGVRAVAYSRAIGAARNKMRHEKVKAFDALIARFDSQYVGAKLFGDCTRADLLREAVRSEEAAGKLTSDAAFYRAVAAVIGNETVRAHQHRDKVVALLTTTSKEAA